MLLDSNFPRSLLIKPFCLSPKLVTSKILSLALSTLSIVPVAILTPLVEKEVRKYKRLRTCQVLRSNIYWPGSALDHFFFFKIWYSVVIPNLFNFQTNNVWAEILDFEPLFCNYRQHQRCQGEKRRRLGELFLQISLQSRYFFDLFHHSGYYSFMFDREYWFLCQCFLAQCFFRCKF